MRKNLLIACNVASDVSGLEAVFGNLEEIRLLPSVANGNEAIDAILAQDVDILLLDLLLPARDGLAVLDFIDRLSTRRKPMVFLLTALADDRILFMVKDRVMYCFCKPFDCEVVLLRVLQLMRIPSLETPRAADDGSLLETQISAGIRAIGIPAHLKGYYYLREAIRLYAESEAPQDLNVTVDIYPRVAQIFNTKSSLVEHAIRNAIEIAWMRGNIETLHDYFGYTVNDYRGKPSNLEFIAMMAQRAVSYVGRKKGMSPAKRPSNKACDGMREDS
ncbi:MAG: sporulation initiation factor Spo0A C-terminal domain-containing protein [Clostridia bacterium]|nr:sporulation initiation factor Spo0A C-terminal domain-containing protein [Clostridia bacterium]